MKTFTSLLSVTLLAAAVAAPALHSSQASSSCAASSSSTNSASSTSSSSVTTIAQAMAQEATRRTISIESELASFPKELITLIAEYDNAPLTAKQLFDLGTKHSSGNGVEKNTKIAVELYQLAAQENFAPAQQKLANRYYFNRGVPANLTQEQRMAEAVRLFTLAANQGYALAQSNLAGCYKKNMGVPANLTQEQRMAEAFRLLTLAAESDYVPAQNGLAIYYEHNIGISANLTQEQRMTEAVRLYSLAANQGYAPAQSNLAGCYEKNRGIPADLTQEQRMAEAVRLYSLAARSDAAAQYNLYKIFYKGVSVRRNLVEAYKLLHRAAKQGHAEAQVELWRAFKSHKVNLVCTGEPCAICSKTSELRVIVYPCWHIFCQSCVQGQLDKKDPACPICKAPPVKIFSETEMTEKSTTKPAICEAKESTEKKS